MINASKGMLKFSHDMQVGHRLFTLPGKCQQIHGHSMTVILSLNVYFDPKDGYAVNDEDKQLEFGEVKKHFRSYLDDFYDHHLLLNENDPWASMVSLDSDHFETLPGLRKVPGDPSTENIAGWIAQWCAEEFRCTVFVEVEETNTNAVMRTAYPSLRKAARAKSQAEVFAEHEGA
jgi:6-pyruvoyl-tetrahydropterin synthase